MPRDHDADRGAWRVTTDRDRITDWAHEHDAVPVRVEDPEGPSDLRVVQDRGDLPGERIEWERFFDRFESEGLAFRYREPASAEHEGAACQLVGRDDEDLDRDAAGEKLEDTERAETEQIGASDTGEGEPVVYDRVDEDAEAVDPETPMSESAGGAEAGALVLDEVYEDPSLSSDPDDEYLVFENDADAPLDLTGWTVENGAGLSYRFPDGFVLEPGESVTLHSGEGEDTGSDLHWGSTEPVWSREGDVVTVRSSDDREVIREPFKG